MRDCSMREKNWDWERVVVVLEVMGSSAMTVRLSCSWSDSILCE